jgi:replicative DNA helicase
MEELHGRIPPHNLDAEASVLGSILLDNEAYHSLEGNLKPDQFYKEANRKIFAAIENLISRGNPADAVTLIEELRTKDQLEEVGGVAYLVGLSDGVPTSVYAKFYADIVVEKSNLRGLITASSKIMQMAYDEAAPAEELMDRAEKLVFEVAQKKSQQPFQNMNTLVNETFEYISKISSDSDFITGVATGFRDLDEMTTGLQPGSLNVIAARPSMGKTAFALSIAQNISVRYNKAVAVFSLEMPASQLVLRMMCAEARVDMNRVRQGALNEKDFERLVNAAGKLSEAPLFIDDASDLTVTELRSKSRRLMAEKDLHLIVIDYMQLMSGSGTSKGGGENRQQEISTISRGLKSLARELNIPVVVLSQLSRQVESRPNHRPMLSDLRECVTGETLVCLSSGLRVPIRDLVGCTPEVIAIAPDGKLVKAQSDLVWSVGTKPVFKMRLSSGRELRCTAQHRIFTENGWAELQSLGQGSRVAIARYLPEPREVKDWSLEHLALLAHLIGDGSYLSGQPLRYTTASEENSEIVARAAKEFGVQVNRHVGRGNWHQLVLSGNGNRWKPAGVNAWLRELGIFNQRSFEKRVPELIFGLSNTSIAIFLQHLWATDGTIFVRPDSQRGAHTVCFSTNGERLARDVTALLLRLGIVARIRKVIQGQYRPMYNVVVSGGADQLCFLDVVGAFGPKKAAAEMLRQKLEQSAQNTNVDTLPIEIFDVVKADMKAQGISQRAMAASRGTSYGGSSHFKFAPSRAVVADYAAILGNPELEKLAKNDLFWDEVISIVPDGEAEVFDLTVPGVASWLADGIVSHNSGAIEQDADLVSFIYRDEYYHKDSEKQGIAEIIIGKQRNGPVGTVELQFHSQHVRFNDLAKDGV